MRVQIFVRLKPGVLDVQGKAVEHTLQELDGARASQVRIGRLIELTVDAPTQEAARARVDELCERVLVNTIIESYEIKFV